MGVRNASPEALSGRANSWGGPPWAATAISTRAFPLSGGAVWYRTVSSLPQL